MNAREAIRAHWEANPDWYPPEAMVIAAADELIEEARRKGIRLHPSRARELLQDERAALDQARWEREQALIARPPVDPDPDWTAIVAAYTRLAADGDEPSKDALLAGAHVGRDRFDAALRKHGVKDARRLGMHLAATP